MTEQRPPLSPVEGLSRVARVPGPPPRPRPQASAAMEPSAMIAPQPTPNQDRRRSRPVSSRPTKVSAGADTLRAISLSLPAELLQPLRDRAIADQAPQADIVLDALTATREQLPALLAKAADRKPADSQGDPFVRHRPRRPRSPLVNLSLRLLGRNVATIDEMVTVSGATSRSMLCSIALRAYLLNDTQSPVEQ